jgi:hypothetical protein
MPATSLPSVAGQTIDRTPSARSAKFRRPCSQMTGRPSAVNVLAVVRRITTEYALALARSWFMNSSVIGLTS